MSAHAASRRHGSRVPSIRPGGFGWRVLVLPLVALVLLGAGEGAATAASAPHDKSAVSRPWSKRVKTGRAFCRLMQIRLATATRRGVRGLWKGLCNGATSLSGAALRLKSAPWREDRNGNATSGVIGWAQVLTHAFRPACEASTTRFVDELAAYLQRPRVEGKLVALGHQCLRVQKPLGAGFFAVVHRGEFADGTAAAIKQIDRRRHPNLESGFHHQHRVLESASERSNGIVVKSLGVGKLDGDAVLVMNHVPGRLLDHWRVLVSMTPEASVAIALRLLEGLEGLHRAGAYHLDLEPDNVLIDKKGIPQTATIIDPLAARNVAELERLMNPPDIDLQAHARRRGASYQSPEQVSRYEVAPRSDTYAVGGILAFLNTFIEPGKAPQDYPAHELPRDLRDIVARARHADPSERYQTVQQMRTDLVALQTAWDAESSASEAPD